MPIIKIDGKCIFFAHVPKCGGTTVELAFSNFGYEWSFWDTKWRSLPKKERSSSSPQHISVAVLDRLFSDSFFDAKFTVVRHPVKRFLSAFNHNKSEGRIPWTQSVSGFIDKLEKSEEFFGFKYDNHFVPASAIVPQNSKVFYLEEGFGCLVDWLVESFGDGFSNIKFEHENKQAYKEFRSTTWFEKFAKRKLQPKISNIPNELEERLFKLYESDYKRFGFKRKSPILNDS